MWEDVLLNTLRKRVLDVLELRISYAGFQMCEIAGDITLIFSFILEVRIITKF